ncbi:fumarylacetoacetate hydrolase domain-containing protein 2-like [Zophobas morio]|uniref:fumarylacetoacetate hydrolase domain-containing protein 2-like n=1 Tax=Zophobas morio TaxID=2755281 RepID=UPI003082A10B
MCNLLPFSKYLVKFKDLQGNIKYGEPILTPSLTIQVIKDLNGRLIDFSSVSSILPPVFPPQIFCNGLNYKQHCLEVNLEFPKLPVVVFKLPQSVIGDNQQIIIPKCAQSKNEVDYEGELAVIIGKRGKNIREEDALNYVYGYTCANDVSARRWQGKKNGNQWSRCKSFDTFCPIGPVIASPSIIKNPNNLNIRTFLNGKIVQSSNTSNMIFSVQRLIHEVSKGTTLLPGSLILTGTPAGVGLSRNEFLKENDRCEIEIEMIGKLCNTVAIEQ